MIESKLKVSRGVGVFLTARDIEIIRFINEFGFCILPQIMRCFGIKSQRAYQIMSRLKKAGLVMHQRVFYSCPGIFYLTKAGAGITDLPALEKIPVGIYQHQITLVDTYLKLRNLYPDTEWISERQLKHTKHYDGVGKSGHVSDGVLIFPDERRVAIEVELSMKGTDRVERIMKGYAGQFNIKEVWYYCPVRMIQKLSSIVATIPFIKIYDIDEFLSQ